MKRVPSIFAEGEAEAEIRKAAREVEDVDDAFTRNAEITKTKVESIASRGTRPRDDEEEV